MVVMIFMVVMVVMVVMVLMVVMVVMVVMVEMVVSMCARKSSIFYSDVGKITSSTFRLSLGVQNRPG
jgi:hypothetical protein